MEEAEGALRRWWEVLFFCLLPLSLSRWFEVMLDQSTCSWVIEICPDAGSIFHVPGWLPSQHTVVTPLRSIQVLSAVCMSSIDGTTKDGFGGCHGQP